MNRRLFLKKMISTATIAGLSGCIAKNNDNADLNSSNFLFILVDDLGWADLGCYGSNFYETPNIDKLANQGVKFTNAYAASSVCSPTRASIFTGKYPARVGMNFIMNRGFTGPKYKLQAPECADKLELSELTFAEVLKSNGYKTFFAGKWHLAEQEEYYPQNQGFDINIGGHKGGQPASYFYPYQSDFMDGYFNVPGLQQNGKPGQYLTDRLTDETIGFIESNRNKPFLAFLSFYSVHTPLEAKKELVDKYTKKAAQMGADRHKAFEFEQNSSDNMRTEKIETESLTKLIQDNAVYAAMVETVDQNVGRLLDKIKSLGLAENTTVIFFSDNGGLSTHTQIPYKNLPTANFPLRAGKGWLYEGGIRQPLIIKSPGLAKAGKLCHEPVVSTDFYPTILHIAGLPLMPRQHIDGLSLVPLLKVQETLDREAIYWHMPHYHSSGISPCGAVRMGDFKLVEYFEDARTELYNLKEDIREANDLSEKYPEKVIKMKEYLKNWRDGINAAMPVEVNFD